MYRLLEFNDTDRLPSACDLYAKAVVLFGMSKTFAMPGLRMGWLASKDDALMSRVLELKDYTTICSSAPSEILALIGLRAKSAILARNVAICRENLELFRAFFGRHSDKFEFTAPAAGTMALVRLKPDFLGDQTATEYCKKLVGTDGIMLLPSSVYDYGDQHIRIGIGRRNCPEILSRWEKSLDENKQ